MLTVTCILQAKQQPINTQLLHALHQYLTIMTNLHWKLPVLFPFDVHHPLDGMTGQPWKHHQYTALQILLTMKKQHKEKLTELLRSSPYRQYQCNMSMKGVSGDKFFFVICISFVILRLIKVYKFTSVCQFDHRLN